MDGPVMVAVLAAAAFHAGWNSLLKLQLEPILSLSLIAVACGVVALPFVPFTGMPEPAAWKFVFASLALHLVYYVALAEAYRTGDLGQAYPIARGAAPLLTALAAESFGDAMLPPAGWLGIGILSTGILLLALTGARKGARRTYRSVGFALLTAGTIAAYTLVDGAGARVAGQAGPYIAWLLLLDGAMMLLFGLALRRGAFIDAAIKWWPMVLAGGAMSSASYGIAIWAMTVAPIAMVAAVRETSVLFAAVISVVLLREPVMPLRLLSVALAFSGVVLLRLAV